MLATVIAFANLVFAALTAGGMFSVWLSLSPRGLTASAYIAQQQRFIRSMNVVMPALGLATILLTVADAFAGAAAGPRLALLLACAACFVVAGAVTRLLNQPINAVVVTWQPQAPPPGWEQLRDRWWRGHVVRTAFGLAGLCLLIAATLASR